MKVEIELDFEIGTTLFFLRRFTFTDGRAITVPVAGVLESVDVRIPRDNPSNDVYHVFVVGDKKKRSLTSLKRNEIHLQALSALSGAQDENGGVLGFQDNNCLVVTPISGGSILTTKGKKLLEDLANNLDDMSLREVDDQEAK